MCNTSHCKGVEGRGGESGRERGGGEGRGRGEGVGEGKGREGWRTWNRRGGEWRGEQVG